MATELKEVALAGFNKLDPFELEQIRKIISGYVSKFQKAGYLGMRLHLKSIHEKATEEAKQGHIHQIDGVLETEHGHFSASAQHRNPYHAIADILENFSQQIKHKHPHKEEWKEAAKTERKLRWKKKKT